MTIYFLSVDDVLKLHSEALEAFGGSAGVRDHGLLESAVMQPQQSFGGAFLHQFPSGMAAAYLFHLCRNHPFIDGNKRAAFGAMHTFLLVNGFDTTFPSEAATRLMLAVARGEIDKPMLPEIIGTALVRLHFEKVLP